MLHFCILIRILMLIVVRVNQTKEIKETKHVTESLDFLLVHIQCYHEFLHAQNAYQECMECNRDCLTYVKEMMPSF